MHRIVILPPPDLKDFISHYLVLEIRLENHGDYLLSSYPDSFCVLNLFYSADLPEYLINGRKWSSGPGFICGLLEKGLSVISKYEEYKCIMVFFKPDASLQLFKVPSSQFYNRVISVDDFLGKDGNDIVDKIASARGLSERIDYLNQFFRIRIRKSKSESELIHTISQDLDKTHGLTRIHDIMHRYKISGRHIDRLFHQHFGTTPKHYARLARLSAAYRMLMSGKGYSIVDVVYFLNYFDQSHLNHDFASYSGVTPRDLLVMPEKCFFPRIIADTGKSDFGIE